MEHLSNHLQVILTPTHLAIVMEYASGGELFERICNAGRFSEDEVSNPMHWLILIIFIIIIIVFIVVVILLLFDWQQQFPLLWLSLTDFWLYSILLCPIGPILLSATDIRSELLPFNGMQHKFSVFIFLIVGDTC